ncbi:hypothetical protein [Synechococcus phage DSL-LC02]|nr:hypothetical protein [Synechococcus phage DSL-LC02]
MDKDLQLAMAAYQSMYEQPDETEEVEEEETEELQEGPLQDLGTTIKYVAGGGAAGAEQQRNRDLATAKRLGDIRAGRTPAGGMRSGDLSTLRGALNNSYEPEGEELDEGEGSYGKTPESTKRWNAATTSRMDKPASEYAKRGDKKKEVAKYSKHNQRTMTLQYDASAGRGKKSSRGVGGRQGLKMTQKDRDDARGQAEYGHTGYDPDWHGGPSAPGGKPKGKKLERQRKTGVSAESVDLFDTILEYLVSEGYADTNESALVIMANMSEEWRQEIVEAFVDPEHGEAPSGRSPLENVSDHPKASVRKKAVKGFKKQMSKEYGGKWKSRTDDPTG